VAETHSHDRRHKLEPGEHHGVQVRETLQDHQKEKKEIGLYSVRGGAIVGEHSVIFAGQGEVIEFASYGVASFYHSV